VGKRSLGLPIIPLKTPCNETRSCADCLSAASICNYFTTIRRSNPPGRIKVILIGKDMGF
jgi:hypothetical protein